MNKKSLLFFLFSCFLTNAQIISGKILSKDDNLPVPYAKIGIDSENAGTIANENGTFKIDLTGVEKSKNLQIEVGGFKKFTVSVDQFLKQNPQTIFLVEKVKDIEEIKINPAKFVRKNWGIKTKTKRIQIGHNPLKETGDQSKELAMLFKTNKKTKIEIININMASFISDKPVFIRFAIYDQNLNPILTEDLHDEITSDKIIDETYSFDVSKHNIWMTDNFYVGIQLLSDFNGRFYMSGALMGNKTIYRNYLGEWQNVPVVSPAINIDVKVQK